VHKTNKTWSAEEEARLRQLRADGLTQSECARILGRPTSSVQYKCKCFGIGAGRKAERAWSQGDINELVKLKEQGLSKRECADRLGRTYGSVDGKLAYVMHTRCLAGEATYAPHAPPREVLADRDRRASQAPRSLTAFLLGDPEVGRSALDRRAGT
jgi:hypothetical protein